MPGNSNLLEARLIPLIHAITLKLREWIKLNVLFIREMLLPLHNPQRWIAGSLQYWGMHETDPGLGIPTPP